VEVWSDIVSFEIGEDISYDEASQVRSLQGWKTRVVIYCSEERSSRREEAVERISLAGVVDRFNISHATIPIDHQIGYVTLSTTEKDEFVSAVNCFTCSFTSAGFEIVKEVKLHEVDQAGRDLIHDTVVVTVVILIIDRGLFDSVDPSIQNHACWCNDPSATEPFRVS
jgi:hypothetical protein